MARRTPEENAARQLLAVARSCRERREALRQLRLARGQDERSFGRIEEDRKREDADRAYRASRYRSPFSFIRSYGQ